MTTMNKARGLRTSERGKKRFETMVIGRQEKKKKGRTRIFWQIGKVCLFYRVWQFPADSKQIKTISHKTDVSRGTCMCLNIN